MMDLYRSTIHAGGILSAALLFASCAPAVAAGDLHQSLSSDGSPVLESASPSTVSPAYPGAGRELSAGERDDALANLPGRQESAEDVWKLWEATPLSAPVGTESIIGTDTRTLVAKTTVFPARATALITFSTGSGTARCTGWLISSNTVATAGHCVNRGKGGGFYPTSSYRIYPGRNGSASPYGACTAKRLYTVTGWSGSGLDTHDYGAIKLNCTIGQRTGWYGYFWTTASLAGLPTVINGYPGDKPLTQWRAVDSVRLAQTQRVFYANDTVGGMSGSPVYYNRSGCGYCSMAVHAYGLYDSYPFNTFNHGTRITQQVFNNLSSWRNAP